VTATSACVLHQRLDVLRVVGEFNEELLDRLLLNELDGFDAGMLLLLIDRFHDLSLHHFVDARFDR